jgi:hypothetical protein
VDTTLVARLPTTIPTAGLSGSAGQTETAKQCQLSGMPLQTNSSTSMPICSFLSGKMCFSAVAMTVAQVAMAVVAAESRLLAAAAMFVGAHQLIQVRNLHSVGAFVDILERRQCMLEQSRFVLGR